MKKCFKTSFLLAFLFVCLAVFSQEKIHWDVVGKIQDEGSNRSKVDEYVWTMSEFFGPRLTASSNIRMTQEWLELKMNQLGLSNVALLPWGEKFCSWDLEFVSVHMLEPDYQMVIGYPLSYTSGTNGKVVEEAMIVNILSKADLEKYRGTLKNKIVLTTPKREIIPREMPDAIRHNEESLKAYKTEGIDINMKKRSQSAWYKRDPKPTDISMDEIEQFFKNEGVAIVLSAGRGGDGTVLVGSRPTRRNDFTIQGVQNSLPMLSIAAEHYNRMYRLLENGKAVKLQIEVDVKLGEEELEARNVIGEIQGTDLSDEVVMIGAHLDSEHAGTGASDNASGCAVVLEAMRILKSIGVQPRRTIRMGLWSSEENGKDGSRGYVANIFGNPVDGTKSPYDNFSVYFNMDNGTGQFRGVHLQQHPEAGPIFEAWMKPFNHLKMETLSQFSNNGTDHTSFVRAGLPGFQFLQDRMDYRIRTWHYNMDTYDHLIIDDLKINAIILASFAYHAAMRDEKFPRKPFTNYRADFSLHQEDLFKDGGTLTNAFADYDNDGDLDLFVGCNKKADLLYRNDNGTFKEVAKEVGLILPGTTRASAWGDYNNDGHMDLFVAGRTLEGKPIHQLFMNDGDGKHFTDVTASSQIEVEGNYRQLSWIDYDKDGDVDLFIGLRNAPNALFQNNNGKFTNVAEQMGIADARKTVGAVWFDYDKDGDLDCYVTNMDGDANGMFRNDGNKFVDVAEEAGLANGGRPLGSPNYGSVRPSIADFDNDGRFDIYTANYGPNGLFRNINGKNFENVTAANALINDARYDTGIWGDYDNDGKLDLFVNGTVSNNTNYPDYLYHNSGTEFIDITPEIIKKYNSDHGAQWVDYDKDGDLDLALTGARPEAMHHLLKNNLKAEYAKQSLSVLVLDEKGHFTRAGSEVRLYKSGTKILLGTNIIDTGSGYNSQNAMGVHFGLKGIKLVDVEVTVMAKNGRKSVWIKNVDPTQYQGSDLIVKVNASGKHIN